MMSWEHLLIASLAAAAFLPLVVWRRSLGLVAWLSVSGAVVLLALGGVLLAGASARRADGLARIAAATPGPRADYVTSDRCRSCHPDQYQSWHRSYHRTMTQRVSADAVVGNFDGVVLRESGREYRLEQRGGTFWVTETGAGQQPAERQIMMMTGSHHQQVYWLSYPPANRLGDFPFLWLIEEQRWIPVRDAFLKDPDLPSGTRIWNSICLQCHATAGQPRGDEATGAMDTRTGELGIACEACHGPADEHVRAHGDPLRRYVRHLSDEPDPTIVNPERLEPDVASQVCAQCHRLAMVRDLDDFNERGFSFRPGDDDLNASKRTIVLRKPASGEHARVQVDDASGPFYVTPTTEGFDAFFWSDGMVRVSGREFNGMIESGCAERGDLQCLSCHSMHQSQPDDQLALGMGGDGACTQCHPAFAGSETALQGHTHHEPESSGSRCMNCHMPYTTYGLLKTIRSHLIDSPTIAAELASGRPNACNLCHLDRSLEWTSALLADWYGQQEPGLSEDQRRIAAGLRWLLGGDAGQRAIAADAMGRADAQDASGRGWTAPHLAVLLDDSYAALRFIAARSLRTLGEPALAGYDSQDESDARRRVAAQVMFNGRWHDGLASRAPDAGRLIGADGTLDSQRIDALIGARDNRPMDLRE